MEADNVSVQDFFNIPNALFQFQSPVSKPATCSFDIEWSSPVTNRSNLKDSSVGFGGEFVLSQATMTWSATRPDGFTFVSDPSGTVSFFAQLSHMRNGVFFGS